MEPLQLYLSAKETVVSFSQWIVKNQHNGSLLRENASRQPAGNSTYPIQVKRFNYKPMYVSEKYFMDVNLIKKMYRRESEKHL